MIDPFQPQDQPPPRALFPFLRWSVRGLGGVLLISAGLSAFSGVVEVVAALMLGWVIDATVSSTPDTLFQEHWGLFLIAVLFFVVLRPFSFGASAAANAIAVAPNVYPMVLSRLNRWTLGQDLRFFERDFAGRIAQKQLQTAHALTEVATETINTIAFALASLIGSALLLLAIHGSMGLALLLWLIAYLALIQYFLPRVRHRAGVRAGARAQVSGQIVDTITNIKTVKLFAHMAHEDHSALQAMRVLRARSHEFGVISAIFRLALMTLAGMLPVLLIGGTLWLWTQGLATAGDIAAAGSIAIRIAQMTGWVSLILMTIYANLGEIDDGIRTLTPPQGLEDAPDATPLPPVRGDIRFEAVRFQYGQGSGGISHLDIHIQPGEKIGIIGASGAGKSTLVALLLRLYDPEQGRICMDGHDLRHITQESLRQQISMVTQETALFNRSALDNIRYGRPDASLDEVEVATRAAAAQEFIQELRDHQGRCGFDAHLGERGVRLSGGQRQRIALARAFLKDAPILVLDEATSALDSEVEALIQESLARLMQGKTVLAIAHRLSTIAAMDRILVLDQGRIAEMGSHADLLARQGLYARYWEHQSGGFLGNS